MNRKQKGQLFGGGVLVIAVASVFLVEWRPTIEEPPPPIRPLKTLVVGTPYPGVKWEYPGRVSSSVQAEMAFEVSGTIAELLVTQGTNVAAGQVLARLDPRDYENAALSAEAELRRAKAQLDRVEEAAAANAVSQQEVSDAQASYDKAEAENNIRQKALDDTELRAQFDGVVARTYVQAFENVQAKQPILNLQNIEEIEIEASIPEARIAAVAPSDTGRERDRDDLRFTAHFDYFPDTTNALVLKEFATEADPVTQTYGATFTMDVPTNLTILPGMTTMVLEEQLNPAVINEEAGILVPLDIVPVDGLGQYFVWLLEEGDGDVWVATRREVEVGEMHAQHPGETEPPAEGGDEAPAPQAQPREDGMPHGYITVRSGLSPGDRIAAAGVHIIQEGQKVRLLHADD